MEYRREIDGLRAFAVLPVILFHAGFESFRGGFVGVDVFFVISGYLITSIILSELEQNRFSLIGFYERRARRILPALLLVIFVCLPFAWLWLLPGDLREFSQSLVAVSLFASNILFWRQSGYFDTSAELKPLLHTWSLAVEEQYYVFFPLFLMFAWAWGRRFILILLGLSWIASLILAQWASIVRPADAFYLLPTRGWELLIGAFAAFYLAEPARTKFSTVINEVGGVLGVLLILLAVFTFDKTTPFPGFYALVPTLGTVLVILCASQQTRVGQFVGNKLFVGLGLISYSAYLWHQPLFAFARHRSLGGVHEGVYIALALLAFLLAYLSWRYVEMPFRRRDVFTRQAIFGLGLSVGVVVLGIGWLGYSTHGFLAASRWDGIRGTQSILEQKKGGFLFCATHAVATKFGKAPACTIGDATAQPEGVLWGDSLAGSALHGLDQELKAHHKAYYAVLADGCVPIVGAYRKNAIFKCDADRHRMFVDGFLADKSVKHLVWIGNFAALIGLEAPHDYYLDDAHVSSGAIKQRILEMSKQFRAGDKRVVFVANTPLFPLAVAEHAAKVLMFEGDATAAIQQVEKRSLQKAFGMDESFLNSLSESVDVVDGLEVFCSGQTCRSHDESGNILFVDRNHLSDLGSERLATAVLARLYGK